MQYFYLSNELYFTSTSVSQELHFGLGILLNEIKINYMYKTVQTVLKPVLFTAGAQSPCARASSYYEKLECCQGL